MKKVLFLMVGVILMFSSFAQEGPQKENILVDWFEYADGVDESLGDQLRLAVIGGMQSVGRLNIMDVSTQIDVKYAKNRQANEEDVNAANVTDKKEAMKALNPKYLITGVVSQMDAVKNKLDNGSIYYTGSISFTLNVADFETGVTKVSKAFTYAGLTGKDGDSKEEAIVNTIAYVKMSMDKFVNENFKLNSKIVQIENCGKKGAETVYINCGSAVGIEKNQQFDVFLAKEVAGKTVKTKIGKLKVMEVQSEDMALCKVVDGGEAIKKAMDDQKEVTVVSGKSGSAGSSVMKGLGGFLK